MAVAQAQSVAEIPRNCAHHVINQRCVSAIHRVAGTFLDAYERVLAAKTPYDIMDEDQRLTAAGRRTGDWLLGYGRRRCPKGPIPAWQPPVLAGSVESADMC